MNEPLIAADLTSVPESGYGSVGIFAEGDQVYLLPEESTADCSYLATVVSINVDGVTGTSIIVIDDVPDCRPDFDHDLPSNWLDLAVGEHYLVRNRNVYNQREADQGNLDA